MTDFICGQEYRAQFPFMRAVYEDFDEDGPVERKNWKPGAEMGADQYTEWCIADGRGEVVYTVIAVFKPGSYPTRVFYLRNWIDPEGNRFGKSSLRVTTTQHFRTLIKGYRFDFELVEVATKEAK